LFIISREARRSLLLDLFGQSSADLTLEPFNNLLKALAKIPVSKYHDEMLASLMLY